jgi:hypothetical protein
MKVVKVRSPFIIEVNEAGAIGSKVELYIYPNGSSVPATPTYTLSKLNPSTTQLNTSYNVSNYVKEYIDNIKPTKPTGILTTYEDNNEWVKFQIKRYKLVGTTYTLLNTIDYVGINGFTDYLNGVNNIIDNYSSGILSNSSIKKNILKTSSTSKGYVNYIVDIPSGGKVEVTYYNLANTLSVTENITGLTGIYNLKILLTQYPNNVNFADGCAVSIILKDSLNVILQSAGFDVLSIEECKYTPIECTFINRYGGWEFLTFFKAQTNAVSVKGSEYNLLPDAINYNIYKGQSKVFNINGTQTVKLNTGWVDENYNELITDLLLSETVLLDNKPVKVKTQSHTFKTQLKDKMINFEIDFEYAFDLINDVV